MSATWSARRPHPTDPRLSVLAARVATAHRAASTPPGRPLAWTPRARRIGHALRLIGSGAALAGAVLTVGALLVMVSP